MTDIKISELEPTTDLEGLYTIGSDKNNLSKKVSLQFLKDAANYANEQGDYAKQAGDTVNGNVGVSDYPEFSASKSYVIGDIVRYNGVLYAFTANHAASAWNGSDVKATSINAITSGKLTELESDSGTKKYKEFSESKSYLIGDVVRYNGALYAFVNYHPQGAWNPQDVEKASLQSLIGDSRQFLTNLMASRKPINYQIKKDDKGWAFVMPSIRLKYYIQGGTPIDVDIPGGWYYFTNAGLYKNQTEVWDGISEQTISVMADIDSVRFAKDIDLISGNIFHICTIKLSSLGCKVLKEWIPELKTTYEVPYFYNSMGGRFNYHLSADGIFYITGSAQYDDGHVLGNDAGVYIFDLNDKANYLRPESSSSYLSIVINNDSIDGMQPSTIKVCPYGNVNYFPSYLTIAQVERKGNKNWQLLNTNKLRTSVDVHLKDESIIIDGVIEDVPGLLEADGSVSDNTSFYAAKPIPVSKKYIKIRNYFNGSIHNYLFCYSEDNFSGFLGRTGGYAWNALAQVEENSIIYELLPGTKFVSFMSKNASAVNMRTLRIAESDSADTYAIIDNNIIPLNTPISGVDSIIVETPLRFQVDVNCTMPDVESNSTELQDVMSTYKDWGMIILPKSYTAKGKKTRLIIGCHGAGGSTDSSQSQTEKQIVYQYLVANGFAVMDMNGLPSAYAAEHDIDINNNVGTPIALQCYIKGYEYVMNKYNLHSEVLVFGGSMGGLMSSNLVMSGSIPVLAHGINCPVTDTYNQLWLNPWSGGLPKIAMGKIYGFAKDGNGNYVYDAEKVKGFNPMLHNLIEVDGVKYKYYPCPLKIWHCENDTTVSINGSIAHIESIRNAGGNAVLRKIPTGGHDPLGVGEPLSNPSGNTTYRNTTLAIMPIVEETYLWFKRFSDL